MPSRLLVPALSFSNAARTAKIAAPRIPNKMPNSFLRVIFSPKKIACNSNTTTGESAKINEKYTGVVYCKLSDVRY